MIAATVFDVLLALVMLVLAWRAVNDGELFRAVVSFVALGLVMAVAWFRLSAPDLALAEAAVGGGLTGALMLAALRRWTGDGRNGDEPPDRGPA